MVKDAIISPRVLKPTIEDKLTQLKWQQEQLKQHNYPLINRGRYTASAAALGIQEEDRYIQARTNVAIKNCNHPVPAHIYDTTGKRQTIKNYWTGKIQPAGKKMSMEIGRLDQGNDYGVTAMDFIKLIYKKDVPREKKATYAQFVCDYPPLKPEPYRIRCVVGRDKLECDFDNGSPTTNMVIFKLLINSVISEASKGARFLSLDVKDFSWQHE